MTSKLITMELSISICILIVQLIISQSLSAEAMPDPYNSMQHHYKPYDYGYNVEDNYGNKQWRQEKSINNEEVHGSYGYRDNNGIYREVHYVADKNGYRATVKSNEPTISAASESASVKIEPYHSVSNQPVYHHQAQHVMPTVHKKHGYTTHLAHPTRHSSLQY